MTRTPTLVKICRKARYPEEKIAAVLSLFLHTRSFYDHGNEGNEIAPSLHGYCEH